MAKQTTSVEETQPPTEREPALETATPAQPRYFVPANMQIERVGNLSSGVAIEWPKVRGGICEHCGVLDPQTPSQYQYKLCPHYRGQYLACSYCPPTKDVDDVNYHATLRVLTHPDKPNTLIVHCDSYECLKKHEEKWKRSNS